MGETKRKLEVRVKEHREEVEKHMKDRKFTRGSVSKTETVALKSAIAEHASQCNHPKIVARHSDWMSRGIREAITIRRTAKTMNRDAGRYHLSHLYNDLLAEEKRD